MSADTIARARGQDWSIRLAGTTVVPKDWYPAPFEGTDTLVLAGAGGQQAPVLAAAGARVTVLDNSSEQLARDRLVAEREALDMRLERGVMDDLSRFADASFDLIVHPCSNCFVPDVNPVWRECFRVLRPGGRLLAGFLNPVYYLLDRVQDDRGVIVVRHPIPYSDHGSLSPVERERLIQANVKAPHLEFGHSLQDQIGGQLAAGFHLLAFADSRWTDSATTLNPYIAVYALTCAQRPR